MIPIRSFWATAMAGGVAVTLLLAAGMTLTIRRLDAASEAHVAQLRAKEQEITLVERLRWTGEVVVSAGRGYLITGDSALLARLLHASAELDIEHLELRSGTSLTSNDPIVADVAEDAERFILVQDDLVAARQRGESNENVVRRFETELLPLQRELEASLDRLVEREEAALARIFHTSSE